MPELPEVETVKRGLNELISGEIVDEVIVYYPKIITNDILEFQNKLKNQKLEKVNRRGKYLIFKFENYDMVSHLRMEGKFQLVKNLDEINKHVHVIFKFKSSLMLGYMDVRKFGRMTLYPKGEGIKSAQIQKLGPEPTEKEFSLKEFSQKLKKYKKPIKNTLLEQKLVAGLGNIYADEVLFKAKINPEKSANLLTEEQIKKLREEIITVLAKAVELKGTTIRSYENAFGENGKYQNYLEVYGKDCKPCPRCGEKIKKIKLGGRGTHFCPKCQKKDW